MVRLLFIISYFMTGDLMAQDQIVKKSGEVIYCDIESIEDYYIRFYELEDTNKVLLYKMDVALVKEVSFAENGQRQFVNQYQLTSKEALSGSYFMVESNIDGLINDFWSLHFQYLKVKYALDIGFKRYTVPQNAQSQFGDDSGSMVEFGVSFPMKVFGTEESPLRGFYLRGFSTYISGSFEDRFQLGRIIEYNQFAFGVQGVFHYQISQHFYIKAYYGLAGAIQSNRIETATRRADLSGGDGLQSIYGLRIGYAF